MVYLVCIFSGCVLFYCRHARASLAKCNVKTVRYLLAKSAEESLWPLFIVATLFSVLDLGVTSTTSNASTLQVIYTCERSVTQFQALLKYLKLTPGWSFVVL